MEFADPNTPEGSAALQAHLASRSYVTGFEPSQNDLRVFRAIRAEPAASGPHPDLARWYRHVKALVNRDEESRMWPEVEPRVTVKVEAKPAQAKEVIFFVPEISTPKFDSIPLPAFASCFVVW